MYARFYRTSFHQFEELKEGRRTNGDEWRLRECHDPILVPKQIEQLGIGRRFEVRDFEGIIRIGVNSEIFNLVERDRLIF